ncbi:MAG: hypothetical protein P1V97_26015 [Planctomycetota bacterium]|nr:hypothetical protein [Planctomycetota bacterium]
MPQSQWKQSPSPLRHFFRSATIPITVTLTFFAFNSLQSLQENNPHRPLKTPSRSPHYGPPLKFDKAKLAPKFDHSELQTKLNKRISVSFKETPFQAALNVLSEECGVGFRILDDAKSIAFGDGLEVTLQVSEVRAEDVLSYILNVNPDFIYELKESFIVIGTTFDLEAPLQFALYDLSEYVERAHRYQEMRWRYKLETGEAFAPIVDNGISTCGVIYEDGKTDYTRAFFYRLVESFLSAIEQQEDQVCNLTGGVFGLRGHETAHKRLELLLRALSENARTKKDVIVQDFPHCLKNPRNPEWSQSLERQLNEAIVSVNFKSTPIGHGLQEIAQQAGINMTISQAIDLADWTLYQRLDNVTAKQAFQLILANHDLAYVPYREKLHIIPKEELSLFQKRSLKIVHIEDLLFPNGKVNPKLNRRWKLLEQIREAVGDDNWDDQTYLNIYGGQMVIYQTEVLVKTIDKLLAAYRQNRARSQ